MTLLQASSHIGIITYVFKYVEQQYGQSASETSILFGKTCLWLLDKCYATESLSSKWHFVVKAISHFIKYNFHLFFSNFIKSMGLVISSLFCIWSYSSCYFWGDEFLKEKWHVNGTCRYDICITGSYNLVLSFWGKSFCNVIIILLSFMDFESGPRYLQKLGHWCFQEKNQFKHITGIYIIQYKSHILERIFAAVSVSNDTRRLLYEGRFSHIILSLPPV